MWCGGPGPPTRLPFRILLRPENLRHRGGTERYSAAIARRKTPEREKLSGREKSAGEIPSRRGEIVAIATVIELGFIGSSSSPSPPLSIIIPITPLRYAVTFGLHLV
jgi:hypothetical protein